MSTFTKRALSGSTHGRGIKVVNTVVGSADTIHTASADSSEGLGDLVTLFAYNSDVTDRALSLAWGGTTDPDDIFTQTIPAQKGLSLVTADMLLRNTLIVKAFAAVTNKIMIFGYVNRISS